MSLEIDVNNVERQISGSENSERNGPSKNVGQAHKVALTSLQQDTWYQKVRPMVEKNVVQSVVGDEAYYQFRKTLQAEFTKLVDSGQHSESFVQQIYDANQLLGMQGVAIVAAYLKEKHRLDNLFVCNSLEAMHNKLKEIQNSKEDGRYALVIGSFCEEEESLSTTSNKEYHSEVDHKIMVGIEKRGTEIKVAIIDALGDSSVKLSPQTVVLPARELRWAAIPVKKNFAIE